MKYLLDTTICVYLLKGNVQVISYEGRVEMIPERQIAEMRGFLKGMDTGFKREDDRLCSMFR